MITARELAARTGVTYRQIDYWCRTGVLSDTASGSGSRRWFEPSDEIIARALARTSTFGAHVQRLALDAIRVRPIDAAGEWLVLWRVGDAFEPQRYRHLCLDDLEQPGDVALVVRLSAADTPAPLTS